MIALISIYRAISRYIDYRDRPTGDSCKVSNEPPIIGGQAQEAPQLRDVSGWRPVPHRGHLCWVGGHPALANHVPQEMRLAGEQVTLGRVQPQPGTMDGCQDLP